MLSDILSLYSFVNKELENASILQALFSWKGEKIKGSEEIKLKINGDPMKDRVWFYEVLPYRDFIFVPFPVNPSVNVDFGKSSEDLNPDSKYFRYVSSPMAKYASGGEENIRVDFVVFGYIPEDLISRIKNNK